MDFQIDEEFKEPQPMVEEEDGEEEAQPQKQVMLTEGEEEEDEGFLEREEGKQFDEVDAEVSPETRRSLINGGENDQLIMEGQEEGTAGNPQKTSGEEASPNPPQDFKISIIEEIPTKKTVEKPQEKVSDSKKENVTLKWAMDKVGKSANNGDDADLENILRASENDVYPLSIHFSEKSKRLMKITRFTVFLVLFYLIIPYDLYVTSADYRIYYYGTALRNERIGFSKNVTHTNDTF